jgi:DNA-binding SARP family transcriptional activator
MESSQSIGKCSPDHRLSLMLLGSPRILINGDPVTIERRKAFALLAYLAMTGIEHHRDMLADMLWPEFDRTRARASLRRVLASLTHAIPEEWWKIDRETLQFRDRPEATYFDVREFRNLLCPYPLHDLTENDMCKDCFDSLTTAVQLYQADFMEGFTLGDCPGFDDWQINQGEELRQDLIGATERLILCHTYREEYETAIRYGKRWARIDPLDEKARLALMQLYSRTNQGNTSLREYESYARLLQSELGVAPQGEIHQLYEAIKGTRRAALPGFSALSKHIRRETAGQTAKQRGIVRSQTRVKNDQMVGREIELELAEAEWHRALRGEPVVLVVSGEPGIGKSHLVRELKKKVSEQEGQVLEGSCYPDGGLPYVCFSQLVLEGMSRLHAGENLKEIPGYVLADLAHLSPEFLAMYPDISPNPRLDPQSEQNRFFDSFMTFCKTAMRTWQAPLLLILEDIHWADTGSLHLLRHLAHRARIDRLKLLIVVTVRDTVMDVEAASALRGLLAELRQNGFSKDCPLQPFRFEQTRALMEVIFQDKKEMVTGLVEAVHHHTEGNPYFVDELCWSLLEDDQLRAQFEADRLLIPASIREVILGRVNTLSDTAQRVLLQAAFLGRQFDADMLFGLCNMDDETLMNALDEAEQAHLIGEINTLEGIRMSFAHILIPLALSESLSGLRRRREHQRVADYLEIHAPEDASSLAYHYAAADNRPKAIVYAQLASRKAIELNVYEDAIKHLRTALNLMKDMSESETRLSILEDYGDAYRLIGEGSQAVAVYQEAQDVWLKLPHRERWTGVRLQRKVGETVTNINRFAEVQRLTPIARACLEAGLASTTDEPPHTEKVRLLAALSRDAWYMRSQIDWTAAEDYATRALDIAEELDQPVEVSVALEALAEIYGLKGMLRERVELCQRRLELSFDPRFTNLKERVNIYLQTGMAFYDVGEYLLALEHLREAESLGRHIWDIPKQADALVRQGQCLFRLDRWDDFLAIETQIRDLESRFTFKRMGVLTCFYYAIQSAVCTWRGNIGLGEQLKAEAHEVMLSIAGSEQNWARNQHY